MFACEFDEIFDVVRLREHLHLGQRLASAHEERPTLLSAQCRRRAGNRREQDVLSLREIKTSNADEGKFTKIDLCELCHIFRREVKLERARNLYFQDFVPVISRFVDRGTTLLRRSSCSQT